MSTKMKEFSKTLLQISVFDHVYTSSLYTWSNHQSEGTLVRKLDKVLINDNWLPRFANLMVEFLASEVFDHCPTIINLQ